MPTQHNAEWLERETLRSLGRLLPSLRTLADDSSADDWQGFEARLRENYPRLFALLLQLYGAHYDFHFHLQSILETAARMWLVRPSEMKLLDGRREAEPGWFQSQTMLGGIAYVDLFAGSLEGIRSRVPYFKELGLTYLHLMPLFAAPGGENDGGYAVSSYREVNRALGTIDELAALSTELRKNGFSLVLDFVFNHTSDEHVWATRALEGDPEYQDYYYMYSDRKMPDAYERTLREIFPEVRPGNFTYVPSIQRWVWTTFHSYQWDLNYGNPAVFRAMLEEMLSLANTGVEVLRLDAVAFIWKSVGTSCENLPEAHMLIQAFNALARISAPSLYFKSEAIVHPDEVERYIGTGECQLSYNPLLMALLWESLATRKVKLLQYSMRERFPIKAGCAWVNYARCHDDIGWTFDDRDAAQLGIDGFGHRKFLNAFYTGRFPGSFALGLPFQENPRTGDCRISGTCASLCGLEKAMRDDSSLDVELAVRRILMIHSVILSIGGIPLVYLGDEIATLNDYAYRDDAAKAGDSRWVHRPATDWERAARREQSGSVEQRVFTGLRRLISIRKECPALAGTEMVVAESGNPHVFAFVRQHHGARLLAVANFSETEQPLAANALRLHGLSYGFTDVVTGESLTLLRDLVMEPYQFRWLVATPRSV